MPRHHAFIIDLRRDVERDPLKKGCTVIVGEAMFPLGLVVIVVRFW